MRPLREARRRRVTPSLMSVVAAWRPRPPRPPVMAYGPDALVSISFDTMVHARRRRPKRVPMDNLSSGSVFGPSSAANLQVSHDTPTICMRSSGCSICSTRTMPKAPLCAALLAPCTVSAARRVYVSMSVCGGRAKDTSCCESVSTKYTLSSKGVHVSPPVRTATIACHGVRESGVWLIRVAVNVVKSSQRSDTAESASVASTQLMEYMVK
mmetsp:Transcript_60817/g.101040  ORF Transcript_60817/g.101040 Transcript_60817/m.101040 type:complete len:211 (-) Transcript_60817:71-703(-)